MKNLILLLFALFCCQSALLSQKSNSISNSEFTIVLFSDTQYYALKDKKKDRPRTYNKQTQWVVDNTEKENIVFSIHLGDMTHRNTKEEWDVGDSAPYNSD